MTDVVAILAEALLSLYIGRDGSIRNHNDRSGSYPDRGTSLYVYTVLGEMVLYVAIMTDVAAILTEALLSILGEMVLYI